jgi:hypothetical protein
MTALHDEEAKGGGVENSDLRNKFRSYCEAAVEMLNSRLDESGGRDAFVERVPRFILRRDGAIEPSETEETNWGEVLSKWDDAVSEMEETQAAVRALEGHEAAARLLGKGVWFPGWATLSPGSHTWVRDFLAQLLYESRGEFREDTYDRLFERMLAYFCPDEFELRVLAPLGGLVVMGGPIQLGPRLRIVELSQSDIDMMTEVWRSPFRIQSMVYSKPWIGKRRWGFELYQEMSKTVQGEDPEADNESWKDGWDFVAYNRFEQACAMLRAYKNGDVWHDFLVGSLTSWCPRSTPLIGGRLNLWKFAWREYTLSREEAAELEEFSNSWGKAKHWKDLELAIRRFSQGCERSSPLDALVDFVIALESLLLPGEERGEYRYRMSLRGAALLGKDPLDRAAVKGNLAEAYDIRSKIVHEAVREPEVVTWCSRPSEGQELQKTEIKFREFVDHVSDYVRLLIRELGSRVQEKKLSTVMQQDVDFAVARGFATPKQP